MVTKNWPELIYVMQYIIDHPEKWDQSVYASVCGTAYCFAGHAAIHVGGRQLRERECRQGAEAAALDDDDFTDMVVISGEIADRLELKWGDATFAPNDRCADGSVAWDMDSVATTALGLSDAEAERLFDPDNRIPDLLYILNSWAFRDGITLPDSWSSELALTDVSR